jgi:hypothetical protein
MQIFNNLAPTLGQEIGVESGSVDGIGTSHLLPSFQNKSYDLQNPWA